MSEEHPVRSPESDVRGHGAEAAHATPGSRPRATDDDLERAVGSLTDVSPSPALRANVMRRVVEERANRVRGSEGPNVRRVRGSGSPEARKSVMWDPALAGFRIRAAAVAVLLIAAAVVWFSLRREPARQIAQQPHGHDIVLPERPGTSAGEARIGTPPQMHRRPSPLRVAGRIRISAPAPAISLEPVDDLPEEEPGTLVVQPIDVSPLPDSGPVTTTPMPFKPIDIPALEIRPIDEPPGEASRPSKQDPDKKQPGGTTPGATR